MTKEELVNEAEKSLDKRLGTYAYIRKQDCYTNYVDGYIDSAEPREKQIAELEKRYNELFFQVNEKTERIAELEKENTDLKAQLTALSMNKQYYC
jgi:chromosome segregation ATPase